MDIILQKNIKNNSICKLLKKDRNFLLMHMIDINEEFFEMKKDIKKIKKIALNSDVAQDLIVDFEIRLSHCHGHTKAAEKICKKLV